MHFARKHNALNKNIKVIKHEKNSSRQWLGLQNFFENFFILSDLEMKKIV